MQWDDLWHVYDQLVLPARISLSGKAGILTYKVKYPLLWLLCIVSRGAFSPLPFPEPGSSGL